MPALLGNVAPVPTPRSTATQVPTSVSGTLQLPKAVATAYTGAQKPAAVTPAAPSLAAQVSALVQQSLLPQQQAIKDAQTQADQQAAAQEANTRGYYTALASILQGIAPQVQAGYTQAANTDAMLGQGLTDQLGQTQAQTGQEAQNVLNLSGGQQQAGQVQQAIGGPGVGQAVNFLGAQLPGQTLASQGAAFGAAAQMLPATAALTGGQQAAQIGNTALTNDQQFQTQLKQLAATAPGLATQYQSALAKQQLATDTFNANQKYRNDVLTQNAQKTNIDSALKVAALTGVVNGKPTLAYQKQVATLTGVNPDGSPTQAALKQAAQIQQGAQRISISGKSLAERTRHDQVEETLSGLRITKPSASSQLSASSAAKLLSAWHDGKDTSVRVPTATDPTKPISATNPQIKNSEGVPQWHSETESTGTLSYSDAVQRLIGLGKSKTAATKLANSVWVPGDGGRPYSGKQAVTVAKQFASEAIKHGVGLSEALRRGEATGVIPKNVLTPVVKQAYKAATYTVTPAAG